MEVPAEPQAPSEKVRLDLLPMHSFFNVTSCSSVQINVNKKYEERVGF